MAESHKGVTFSDEHRQKISIAQRGENHYLSTLTNDIVTEIKIKMSNGAKNANLAREYDTTVDIIKNIKYEKSWKHVII